jgi:hypothetical protein
MASVTSCRIFAPAAPAIVGIASRSSPRAAKLSVCPKVGLRAVRVQASSMHSWASSPAELACDCVVPSEANELIQSGVYKYLDVRQVVVFSVSEGFACAEQVRSENKCIAWSFKDKTLRKQVTAGVL